MGTIRRRNFNEVRICTKCHRRGTHGFTKDAAGLTICGSIIACARRRPSRYNRGARNG